MKYISQLTLILFSCVVAFGQALSPEEAQKKITEVMPAGLPQRDPAKRGLSDAQLERLKGKVRSVTNWAKAVGATEFQRGSINEYDENGYLLRSISYDQMGNPYQVRVYGYIDDKRVSRGGYISYPYDAPAPPAPPEKGTPAPRDYRYTTSYEHEYDTQGRLIERVVRANNGKVIQRTKFGYEGDQVSRVDVNGSGTETIAGIDVYNSKGELLRTIRPAISRYPESLFEYRYDKFDERGNWLERTGTGKAGQWNGTYKYANWIEKREITYY